MGKRRAIKCSIEYHQSRTTPVQLWPDPRDGIDPADPLSGLVFANLAMKTKSQATQASLRRRVRQFYKLLNERDFSRCHEMIDPRVRHRPESVTLLQYSNSAAEFLDYCGSLRVVDLNIELHLQEPNMLYEGRDFAVGKTVCEDARRRRHTFIERWVRDGRSWYTRSTGFVIPAKVAG